MKTAIKLFLFIPALFFSLTINAQWERISDLANFSTNIRDRQIIQGSGSTLYFRNIKSLYRSQDAGSTWDPILETGANAYGEIDDFFVEGSRIWVVGNWDLSDYFLIYSNDAGETWTEKPITEYPKLSILNHHGILFMGCQYYTPGNIAPLYRSYDNGETWEPLLNNGLPVEGQYGRALYQYQDMLYLYLGTGEGMYVSEDDGDTWTKCENGSTLSDPLVDRINISQQGFFIRYFDNTSGQTEDFYTVDGKKWEKPVFTGVENPSTLTGLYNKWFTINYRDGANPLIMFSSDKGKTWNDWYDTETGSLFGQYLYVFNNFLYAFDSYYLYRRSLEEAVAPPAPTPQEIESAGGISMDHLLAFFGVASPEELPDNIMEMITSAFEDNESWASPEGGIQPGTCSLMGMPVWKVNSASMQLYVKDVIFKAKAPGPAPVVDLHYNRYLTKHFNTPGPYWSLGMDMEIILEGDKLHVVSGATGEKVFVSSLPLNQEVTLYDTLHPLDSLYFDTSKWHYYVRSKRRTYHFSQFAADTFLLSSITDPENNTLRINRNADGKITDVTDASGRMIEFTYLDGICSGFKLPDGRSASFAYNAEGLLSRTVDLAGTVTEYSYDDLGNLDTINIAGKKTAFSYEEVLGFRRLSSARMFTGDSVQYHFIPIDSITSVSEITANGVKKAYMNVAGQTVKVSLENGTTIAREFNSKGLLQNFSGKGRLKYDIQYDAGNNPTLLTLDGKTVFSMQWDARNNLKSKTNALGNTWNYQYDEYDRLTAITSPENRKTLFTYYADGLLKSIKKGSLLVSFEYDQYGNITQITNPNGGITQYRYSPDGYRLLSVTSPEGRQTAYHYDNNQRLDSVGYADGSFVRLTYDCCSQTGKINENGFKKSMEKNDFGLPVRLVDEEGHETVLTYDENEMPASVVDPLGHTVNYTFRNEMLQETTDAEGNVTRFRYDAQHKLIMVVDAKGQESRYLRDKTGMLTGMVSPGYFYDSVIYARDAIGEIISVRNARGETVDFEYDKDAFLVLRRLPDEEQHFSRDESSLLTSISDASGTTYYDRDISGFIQSIRYPDNLEVRFEYDKDGNRTKIIYPDNFSVDYTVNDRNRIEDIAWNTQNIALTYDPVGNLLTETRNNTSRTRYDHYKNNRVRKLDHYEGDTLFASYDLTRDANGNVITMDLIPAIRPQKGPDSWDEYDIRNDNQLFSNMKDVMGSQAYYSYDKDGNCFLGSGTVQFEASYSALNQLTKFKKDNDSVFLSYDALGNIRTLEANGIIKKLHYDHKGRLLFETDQNGNVLRYYIYKAHRIMAFVEEGKSYFPHYDPFGNTLYISDESGNVLNRYFYTSFGEILAKEEALDYPFTFNGAFGAFMLSDGYYLLKYRLYQAINGRFLQRDPIGLYGDMNNYRYAHNNPFLFSDPYGTADEEIVDAGALDGGYDYDPGVAGGTADAFNPNLNHSGNSKTDPTRMIKDFYDYVTDSPAGDFLPPGLGTIVSIDKARKKFQNGDGLAAMIWQFVPFNNTMEWVYKEKRKEMEKEAWDYYHMPDGREKLVAEPYHSCSWW